MAKRSVARRRTVRSRRAAKAPAASAPAPVAFRYVESSALLAGLLEQDADVIAALRAGGARVTSALTFAEAHRALVRARVIGRLKPSEERAAIVALQTFERRCTVMAVSDAVLTRAGRPFPVEPIRTLDAVHLATAELLGEAPQLTTILTRNERVRENARALGYVVG